MSSVPQTMTQVVTERAGGPEVMRLAPRPGAAAEARTRC